AGEGGEEGEVGGCGGQAGGGGGGGGDRRAGREPAGQPAGRGDGGQGAPHGDHDGSKGDGEEGGRQRGCARPLPGWAVSDCDVAGQGGGYPQPADRGPGVAKGAGERT